MNFFGFPDKFSLLVMACLNSSVLNVLINGKPSYPILPSRGVRQGDPISPYLFILALEYLSLTISELVHKGLWAPIKINSRAPSLSHLMFVDDIILFTRADTSNVGLIYHTISKFSNLSGLNVNLAKI